MDGCFKVFHKVVPQKELNRRRRSEFLPVVSRSAWCCCSSRYRNPRPSTAEGRVIFQFQDWLYPEPPTTNKMYNTAFNEKIYALRSTIQLVELQKNWAPPIDALKLDALESRMEVFLQIENDYHALAQEQAAVQEEFRTLMKASIQLLPHFRTSLILFISPKTDRYRQMQDLFARFRSKSMKVEKTEEGTAPSTNLRSSSKQSKTDRLDHFYALRAFITMVPEYKPVKEELSLASLTERIEDLQKLIESNSLLQAKLKNLRDLRNAASQEINVLNRQLLQCLKALKKLEA